MLDISCPSVTAAWRIGSSSSLDFRNLASLFVLEGLPQDVDNNLRVPTIEREILNLGVEDFRLNHGQLFFEGQGFETISQTKARDS